MNQRVLLEPAAETVCIENSVPPLIFELPPEEGRRVLEEAQDAPVCLYPAQVEASMVDTGQWGRIPVYRVTPVNSGFAEHVIFYIHGAGWVFGSFHTHEKLVRASGQDRLYGDISGIFPLSGSALSNCCRAVLQRALPAAGSV